MAKVKGYITSVNMEHHVVDVTEFGGEPHSVSGPMEARIEILITEGDFGALLDYMYGITSPLEIEIPNGKRVKKEKEKPQILRKWRLIEVGEE